MADIDIETSQAKTLAQQVAEDVAALKEVIVGTAAAARAPNAEKVLRSFTPTEAAEWIGCTVRHLNNVSDELQQDVARVGKSNARTYTLAQIMEARQEMARRSNGDRQKALKYLPWRSENEGEQLSVVSLVNFKGGSAKTTSAIHLAQYLALRGYRVLLVDLDGQGSAGSVFCERDILEEDESLYAAIRFDNPVPLKSVIRPTHFVNVDLVPGGLWMFEWENEAGPFLMETKYHAYAAQRRLSEIQEALEQDDLLLDELRRLEIEREQAEAEALSVQRDRQFFLRLRRALDQVKDDYDIVVCDTPPSINITCQVAIGSSDHLVVTIHPEWFDIKSMHQYLISLGSHLDVLEENAPHLGDEARYSDKTMHYLLTRFEPSMAPERAISGMMDLHLNNVIKNPMLKSSAISEAGLSNETIYESDKKKFTASTLKRAVESVNECNRNIEKVITNGWGRS